MYNDDQNPWDTPYPNDGGQTVAADPYYQARYDAIASMYRNALGREGSKDEIDAWANGLAKSDMGAAQQAIYASDEAKAYGARNAQAPQQQNPVDPNPGPAPAPAPAPAPGPAPGPTAPATPQTPNVAPTVPQAPAYVPPPAFAYQDFSAPTGADVLSDPGYGFELNQGIQAIGAKNAALGTLNTGGTIKDFMGFGQNLASTKYNDLFNRKLTEYGTNRGNALDTYNVNYGTQYKDPYSINYASQYQDPFANSMQSAGLTQQNQQFNASLGQNQNQFSTSLDWAKFLQNYKSTVTDPFAEKYSLLGLL